MVTIVNFQYIKNLFELILFRIDNRKIGVTKEIRFIKKL